MLFLGQLLFELQVNLVYSLEFREPSDLALSLLDELLSDLLSVLLSDLLSDWPSDLSSLDLELPEPRLAPDGERLSVA